MIRRSLDYLAAARLEYVDAAESVEALTGQGADFDAEARRVEEAIAVAPEAHPPDPDAPEGRDVRRARIGRFPWRYVYVLETTRILIIAVAHKRREPGYWLARLD